ncbi:hypothetical protein AB0D38_30660 [Streptomyces sp. NPDC048279]|uniref:hypothetical protein n=1 Tax=Streptomyces sp. NPDC048279 TaxID=3154714 RepID=UPI003412B286
MRLKVAQTGGVSSTGAWYTLERPDFTGTVTARDGFLVHPWTLRPGREVSRSSVIFATALGHLAL